ECSARRHRPDHHSRSGNGCEHRNDFKLSYIQDLLHPADCCTGDQYHPVQEPPAPQGGRGRNLTVPAGWNTINLNLYTSWQKVPAVRVEESMHRLQAYRSTPRM